jgi:hypothetical protein
MPGGSLERFSWESLGCGTPGLPPDSAPLVIGPSGLTLKGDLKSVEERRHHLGNRDGFHVDWAVELHEAVVEVQEEDAWRNAPDVRNTCLFVGVWAFFGRGRALVGE